MTALRSFLVAALAAGLVAACADPAPEAPPEPPPIPIDHEAPIGPEPPPVHDYQKGEIRSGDSLSTAMGRLGSTAVEVDGLARGLKGVFDLRYSRPGHWFELWRDAEGTLSRFRYTASLDEVVYAYRAADGHWVAYEEPLPVETSTLAVDGVVDHSLYLAVDKVGERPWLTLSLVDIFAWDIDFFTETRKGDRFRVVFEKRTLNGEFVGYGNILAAEYVRAEGERFVAFRYVFEDGKVGYYRPDGTAVEKAFLKSPIKFATITSRYGMRRHPVLKYARAHKGVDYAAPMGTSIWAVGDGVVTFAGRRGGYGRVVYLRHANGLSTRYAHMRGYARGIKKGVRVSQKQVIGYVGKSGLATGPHLHFEVLRGGRHTNPLSVAVPPAPPIPEAEKARFRDFIAPAQARLTEGR